MTFLLEYVTLAFFVSFLNLNYLGNILYIRSKSNVYVAKSGTNIDDVMHNLKHTVLSQQQRHMLSHRLGHCWNTISTISIQPGM
jgi:hypothetical protein